MRVIPEYSNEEGGDLTDEAFGGYRRCNAGPRREDLVDFNGASGLSEP